MPSTAPVPESATLTFDFAGSRIPDAAPLTLPDPGTGTTSTPI